MWIAPFITFLCITSDKPKKRSVPSKVTKREHRPLVGPTNPEKFPLSNKPRSHSAWPSTPITISGAIRREQRRAKLKHYKSYSYWDKK